MEKDLEDTNNFIAQKKLTNTNLSSFAYDGYKKTLYYLNDNKMNINKLKEEFKNDKIFEVPSNIGGKPKKESDSIFKEERKVNDIIKEKRKDGISPYYQVPETLRFWRTYSDQQISPSGLTATWRSNDTEKFSQYYSNIDFTRGIHYWEIICPISCSGIEFGIKNKETNDKIWVSFRTTTPRVVGMKLDLEHYTLSFWLNGRPQTKRNQSIPKGEYMLLIKMKNYGNTVILNPFAQLEEKDMNFPQNLLLSLKERDNFIRSYSSKKTGNDTPLEKKAGGPKLESNKESLIEPKENPSEPNSDEVPDEGSPQQI